MPPAKNNSARFVAIESLCRLQKSRKPVTGIFNSVLTAYPLESNDRQLATNIIYGVLRKRDSLDCMLQHLCRQPLKKLKPFVHQALRTGLFQILYLDRIPESAAVNESVKAVQTARLPKRLQGFVNGVLRNSIRKRDELLNLLKNPEQPILNHPLWLYKRWEKQYGREEAIRICEQNNEQAVFSLQVNSCATDRNTLLEALRKKKINACNGQYCDATLILTDFHGGVSRLPGFNEGLFQVQDQGAQLLTRLIGPMVQEGEYLDACAGVGGKTSVLVQLAAPLRARISAVEPDVMRQEKFKENMKRLHPKLRLPLFPGSLQDFAVSNSKRFHGILLDAPCSGTGVIRRHPDIRWNRRVEDFDQYQKTQLDLLHTAATLLRPQGVLVYATCSLEEEENEQVIEQFLTHNPDFSLENCTSSLPSTAHTFVTKGCFAPLPGPEIDGFFSASLIKLGACPRIGISSQIEAF
ncbi:MAG: 16S rRNA (cytosine(967)-C(5))-methyltransferase RsmB [Thermodesulfobacteriota bacterium]|nr:16S rRNA (cytosine(967)-C(5))-methyltransferase RsmB [Thermodesulfobacteriota bacterium]